MSFSKLPDNWLDLGHGQYKREGSPIMFTCSHCNESFDSNQGLGFHLSKRHGRTYQRGQRLLIKFQRLVDESGLSLAEVTQLTEAPNSTLSQWYSGSRTPRSTPKAPIRQAIKTMEQYNESGADHQLNPPGLEKVQPVTVPKAPIVEVFTEPATINVNRAITGELAKLLASTMPSEDLLGCLKTEDILAELVRRTMDKE